MCNSSDDYIWVSVRNNLAYSTFYLISVDRKIKSIFSIRIPKATITVDGVVLLFKGLG